MMNADPRIAFATNRTVTARQQQRRTLHRYGFDIVDPPAQPGSQFEAGVDDGMEYDPRGIGLVGILRDLPAVAEAADQTLEIGRIAHGPRPAERPLDRARGSIVTFGSEQCREQAVAGGVADTDILGRGGKI